MAHSRTEWRLKHTGQVAHLPQDYSAGAIAGAIAGAGVITGVSASLILERVEKYFLIFPRIAELELIQDPFLWETVLVILKNENFDSIRLLDLLS